MANTIRTFIAFELPQHVLRRAAALQEQMQTAGIRMRWVRPTGIHLTVRFLGDIAPEQVAPVAAAMDAAVQGRAPIALFAQGLGVFPNINRPRVLWMGLGGETDRLQALHGALDDHLAEAGFVRETRPFRAHLTLARAKGRVNARSLLEALNLVGGFAPESFQAAELVLFQSDLRPTGAVYTPLARAALAASGPEAD